MKNITCVIVSYNRADLLKIAYESLRKWSDMPVIIVDGSTADNECDNYSKSLKSHNTEVVNCARNIGHGAGMDIGIKKADTDYILLMDSDVKIEAPCFTEMVALMSERVFGCGLIVTVDGNGNNIEPSEEAITYLHPHFAMINRDLYRRVPGFVHHGAPCIRTMQYLNTFKKFSLVDFPVSNFIEHAGRGTRSINPPEFLNNWK